MHEECAVNRVICYKRIGDILSNGLLATRIYHRVQPYSLHTKSQSISFTLMFGKKLFLIDVPVQVMPLPVKPLLHMQEKLPTELVHIASASQLCVPVEHSSTSDERKIIALGSEQKKK